jgi:hypothetical protein
MFTLLWKNNDPHQLNVSVAYNYNPVPVSTYTVSAAKMVSSLNNPTIQREFELLGRAEAIQVTVADVRDTLSNPITGQGPTLIGLSVTYGTRSMPKTYPVPVVQRN